MVKMLRKNCKIKLDKLLRETGKRGGSKRCNSDMDGYKGGGEWVYEQDHIIREEAVIFTGNPKCGKASGIDWITPEILKCGGTSSADWMYLI